MKRTQVLITGIFAALALSAIAASSAFAAETTKLLPEGTAKAPVESTFKSGLGTLRTVSGKEVVCKKDKGTSSFTSSNHGTYAVLFEECTTKVAGFTVPCTGVGDSKETIANSGEIHFLLALEMLEPSGTLLIGAFVFLVKQFHFVCEALGQKELVLVRGCFAGKAEKLNELVKTINVSFTQWGTHTGETLVLQILPVEATSEVNCLPESSILKEEGEKFELSAIIGSATAEKFIQNKVEVTILLHNPEGK